PLRHASAHHSRGQARGQGDGVVSAAMLDASRRSFLKGAGALVVAFQFAEAFAQAPQQPQQQRLPGSLQSNRMLDSWIRIEADGTVTVFTGKIEFGQGIKTALAQ